MEYQPPKGHAHVTVRMEFHDLMNAEEGLLRKLKKMIMDHVLQHHTSPKLHNLTNPKRLNHTGDGGISGKEDIGCKEVKMTHHTIIYLIGLNYLKFCNSKFFVN